jgi:hypothetical protein
MIYMWFTGINYFKLAVEKVRDSISKPGFTDKVEELLMYHMFCRTKKQNNFFTFNLFKYYIF